ncbi:hypothetical protein U9M48_025296 [Paspalum notatum var. saurae]|uniref:Uncharacterized protein n=1 Tax=Paspalum notatum var. saurae TaxID=547442 RepID=A0AAQ3TQ70_PASNO
MAPPPPKELLTVIEAALLGPAPPSPAQRMELLHAVRDAAPFLRALLSYPVRHLYAVHSLDCTRIRWCRLRTRFDALGFGVWAGAEGVRSKTSGEHGGAAPDMPPITLDDTDAADFDANREWVLYGRELLEIYRLAAGLWYTERRDLITSLYILLRELNREEPAGIGRSDSEHYVLDFRGALVERRAIVERERERRESHCLALSAPIKLMSPKEIKDVFSILKDCAAEANQNSSMELQMMRTGNSTTIEGFVGVVRLAWSVHLMLTQDRSNSREMPDIWSCLEIICRQSSFEFLCERVLKTAAYQLCWILDG